MVLGFRLFGSKIAPLVGASLGISDWKRRRMVCPPGISSLHCTVIEAHFTLPLVDEHPPAIASWIACALKAPRSDGRRATPPVADGVVHG